MERYKFPPMLGPASAHREGTREWAECLGNELDYRVDRAEQDAVEDLIPPIKLAMRVAPWTVWLDPPCGSADAYFRLCTGLSYEQIWVLINTYKADHGLPRSHIPGVNLDLTDEEAAALVRELHDIVENDRYPFSPRIRILRELLNKLRPEPVREPLSEPRHYEPPRGRRYRRRG
jgi:hypothetical protein